MNNDQIHSKYHLIKVEKTTAPDGMLGDNWYLYVIQKGNLSNTIMDCKKTGTLDSVTKHAKELAETMNLRNSKGGRR
jgi:hypothetical protein